MQRSSFFVLLGTALLCGCGSSTSNIGLSATSYDFGITPSGTTVTKTAAVLQNLGTKTIAIQPTLTGASSFSLGSGGCGSTLAPGKTCSVTVQYAPTGTNTAQETGQIDLGVEHLPQGTADVIQLTGTPGVLAIHLSSGSYDFGETLLGSPQSATAAVLTNAGNLAAMLNPTISGDASFSLAGNGGCGAQLAAGGTCNVLVNYAPTTASAPNQQTATVNLGVSGLPSGTGDTVVVTGTSGALTGTVSDTANTMVANYTLTMPFAGTWNVSFGPDTGYGRTTSTVTVATGGTATSVLVAGMLPNSTYHMRAMATLADGATGADADHTFATGALPQGIPASFPVTLGTGTPQPGIELMDPLIGTIPTSLLATDLQGNTIWTYTPVVTPGAPLVYPAKLLANGDVLMYIAPNSFPTGGAGINVMREIDLAGTTVRELTMANLQAAMTHAGFMIPLNDFTHDFVPLPNGHVLIMANTSKAFTNLTGYPGVTNVVGDVVIDLDANWNPVWVWNELDHFDVNRHPWTAMFPDWTHSNSLDYSKDDGDFIVSMRHQNWVAKVDYNNGAGTGDVLWKLGEQGDFTLKGGTDPTDWFYAQHDVTYSSANTTGVYSLTVMDNGDDRVFPAGVTCGSAGAPACLYTTIQELQLDESAMTATFQFHQVLPTPLYSYFAGNVEVLANGNIEYMLSGVTTGSEIYEVTPGSMPQTVWEMSFPGSQGYRGYRLPSFYPGVQWTR
jgi:arylsulfate sulfotransferase